MHSFILGAILQGGLICDDEPGRKLLTLEELQNARMDSSASLTGGSRRDSPASVTVISRDMLRHSGARSLDEALEIFVPEFYTLNHITTGAHMSLRGISSDLDHKFLILVDGVDVNDHILMGAVAERYLPLLGDIERIEMIRGPGSAIYGHGAIGGVINIITQRAGAASSGPELTLRQGFFERQSAMEVRGSRLLGAAELSYYLGISDYRGADEHYAPNKYGEDVPHLGIRSGHALQGTEADRAPLDPTPLMKGHLALKIEDFDTFVRFVHGSETHQNPAEHYVKPAPLPPDFKDWGQTYDQWIWQARKSFELSQDLTLETSIGLRYFQYEQRRGAASGYEPKWEVRDLSPYLKALFQWRPNEDLRIAFGGGADAYFAKTYGLTRSPQTREWNTLTQHLMGEASWDFAEQWTLVLGGRADFHPDYDKPTYSPRTGLVFKPGDDDTFKLSWSRSFLRDSENESQDDIAAHRASDVESIESWEFIWEHRLDDSWSTALSLFTSDWNQVAWAEKYVRQAPLSETRLAGATAEIKYADEDFTLRLSHAYTFVTDLQVDRQAFNSSHIPQEIGLSPLAEHVSKLYARFDLSDHWSIDGSLRCLWGFPEARKVAKANREHLAATGEYFSPMTNGDDTAFGPSLFLNLGLEWNPNDSWSLRFDAHNILGWIDEDLNKRNNWYSMSQWRDEAPAFTLTATYRF
ncbi:MAG: hypothetical protein RL095_3107 [Verrucomicrobiota bacterium]|jgi:outer membrane receptor protein involved in Fe transport